MHPIYNIAKVTNMKYITPQSNYVRDLSFQAYPYSAQWNEVPGIYMFCSQLLNDIYIAHYIGQASSFKARLSEHEQWFAAVKEGANVVLAAFVPDAHARDYFESNMIFEFQPKLNVHHKFLRKGGMLSDFRFPSR
jgi:hypothetical protein